MGEIFFCIKMFFVTLFVVGLMQVKMGETTLEEKAYVWIKTSPFVSYLDEVAQGALASMRVGYREASSVLSDKAKETLDSTLAPGHRKFIPDFKRSKEYLEKINEKVQNLDEAIDNVQESYRDLTQQKEEAKKSKKIIHEADNFDEI